MKKLYIIIILIMLIIFFIYKKNFLEKFLSSNKAEENIYNLFIDSSDAINYNNINILNKINAEDITANGNIIIDMSGNTTIKNDLNILGDIIINNIDVNNYNVDALNSKDIDVSGTADIKNNLLLNDTDIRYFLPGVTLIYCEDDQNGIYLTNTDDIKTLSLGLWKLIKFDNKSRWIIVNPGFGVMLFGDNFDITTEYTKVINYGLKPVRLKLNHYGTSSGATASINYGNDIAVGTDIPKLKEFLNTDLSSVYIEGPTGHVLADIVSSVYVFLADSRYWAAHKNTL